MCIADGKEQLLQTGDLYISFPNQIHYYKSLETVRGFVIIVSADLFSDLKGVFSKKIPQSPVIKREDLPKDTKHRIDKIYDCLQIGQKLSLAAANGYMQSLLAEALQGKTLINSPIETDSVRKILLYCLENYTEPITLDSIAKALYLSRYYISHIFTERLNISFPDFINGLRIEHACRILSVGCNITEIAFASGFGSIRSFNRNFEQIMGMTPSQFIRENAVKPI